MGLDLPDSDKRLISVSGEKTENVSIGLNSKPAGDNILILGEKVNAETVNIK